MKKIIKSAVIALAVAAVAGYGTYSFFSDTETSTGNTFTAGSIDLKVSNESYKSNDSGVLVTSPETTWTSTDLTGQKFFDFADLKPGDIGEDTIDIMVDNNPAWVCAEVTLTTNDDVTCTDPELENDTDCVENDNLMDGDLAQQVEFIWWSDDGDNVLEESEVASLYYLGPDSISTLLGADNKLELTLADSQLNFFDRTRLDQNQVVNPIPGQTTKYVGKGWCFGDMNINAVADGEGAPTERGTGFTCDGSGVNNAAQSDRLTADISFTAVQARNNLGYLCPEHD